MEIAGILPGADLHHLDHLAPLCSLFEVPLVVTEETIFSLAKQYYPSLQLLFCPPLELPSFFLNTFDCALTCLPRPLIDLLFFTGEPAKRIHTIWCPHGNSDKGWKVPLIEGVKEEELLLVYGNRMRLFLEAKQISIPTLSVGNYRLLYYQRHLAFYESLFPSFPYPTLLYAPTWQDKEKSSSLEGIWKYLSQQTFTKLNLLIKPHPHLQKQYPFLLDQLKNHATVLEDQPLIYPLLQQIALYMGDMSSIGYDFLSFNRPMIFFNPNRRNATQDLGLYLTQCGIVLCPEEYPVLHSHISSLLQEDPYKEIRAKIYQETFDSDIIDFVAIKQYLTHDWSCYQYRS